MTAIPVKLAAAAAVALSALGPLAASLGASAAAEGPAGLACEIRTSRSGGLLLLEPVVRSDRAARGDYDFVVEGRGSGSRSDIAQGGAFTLAAGETARLAQVSLSSSARFEARLEIEAGGRRAACRAVTPRG
ncbi:curli-like amyloid fiber formation chaperone CsgH [Salinarimonas rosea]|uniref:curli-like amyloid fiber formation chaperone CsgH n=1 Tax=Salinarimonas rosea TaxID=552063 RepID=UPI000404884D|nr:curli-like amyloid fiber formation chaperone CsgH [Salinarimonas rosea]